MQMENNYETHRVLFVLIILTPSIYEQSIWIFFLHILDGIVVYCRPSESIIGGEENTKFLNGSGEKKNLLKFRILNL